MKLRLWFVECVLAVLALSVLGSVAEARMFACQIQNSSGETIYVKIVGHQPSVTWYPGKTGVMFVNNDITDSLEEGERVVVVWDRFGTFKYATRVTSNAPATITLTANGAGLAFGIKKKVKKK